MPITIRREKLRDYLLNPDHPENSGKARFFLGGGFTAEDLASFETALTQHLKSGRHVKRENGKFGERLVVEGQLQAPDNRTPLVRSVWMIKGDPGGKDGDRPSVDFVTAYPIDKLDIPQGENPFRDHEEASDGPEGAPGPCKTIDRG